VINSHKFFLFANAFLLLRKTPTFKELFSAVNAAQVSKAVFKFQGKASNLKLQASLGSGEESV